MYRLTVVFSSLLLIAVWSAPIDAAEGQRRARRRGSGTTQTQRAPQRTAPRASSPQRTAPARRAVVAPPPAGAADAAGEPYHSGIGGPQTKS